ncbi:hypothetical protein [Haloarcula nitratireducens]|uniref:Uncharacterized protein n=1 Tax=Haloarcula nitratireducens TaxID=2487749 RepID=A0AAW4PAI4_9EURY|nr:hypothetical protein [Halomicroarcula nitratireducens]MBX0294485.1 hypothetical protein [Halomicroarcula nitratireducens]
MNRRRLLASCGTCLAGLAGCLSESPAGSDDTPNRTEASPSETTTDSPAGSPTERISGTEPDATLAVGDLVVRKSVRYESTMGSGGVLTARGRQYVVASVRGPRDASTGGFSLVTDSESWDPGLPDTAGARNHSVAGIERPFLAFTLPSPLSASNPRIRRDGENTEWSLPAGATEALAASSPRFELDSVTVPEAVSQGEPLTVSLSATNVSETDGRFLAAIYWPTKRIADDDESHVVERTVAAGESVSASLDIDTEYTTNEVETIPLRIRGHVTAERDVNVEDVSTDW